ncbi:MAG: 50S ribosomal protein L23 [Candidatus Omnitrophica bacterium]|nr:50S ribosomal protein L23 [Candidatus Omnitrophota bacterium]
MANSYDIVKTLIRTEKGTVLEAERKYLFQVDSRSTKVDIQKAIENIYKVKVQDVNTIIVPGKKKRVRQALGRTPDWKKAVVTLKEGSKIEVT